MATLVVTALDAAGDPEEGMAVLATLTDLTGLPLREFTSAGLVVNPVLEQTNSSGVASLDLVPNADILRENTYYSVKVGFREPVLILKGSASQSLLEARVITPDALGPAATFENIADVDLEGADTGDTIRFQGGRWVSWPWPGGGGSSEKIWVLRSASATLTEADSVNRIKVDASGGPISLTLPTAVGNNGLEFIFKRVNTGSNMVTVLGSAGQTIDGGPSFVLDLQWSSLSVSSDGSNWMVI